MVASGTPVTFATQAARRSTMPGPWKPSASVQNRTARSRLATVKLVWLNPTIMSVSPSTVEQASYREIASIDGKRDPVDEARAAGDEEHHRCGDLVRLTETLQGAVPAQPVVRG